MEKEQNLDRDYGFFSSKRLEDIIILRFKKKLLFHTTDLMTKGALLNYLDCVSESDSVKVLVIMGSPRRRGLENMLNSTVKYWIQGLIRVSFKE
ncbi:MAG: hypothetical protein ISS59_08755 [Desulfobacteraceae bacterium]|nr:hypothetical protein [Desulfobacteraceae bacterium]